MYNIETEGEPVIWVLLKLPGNKSIRLQCYYRQWRQVDQNGYGYTGTETPKSQEDRFQKIANIWEQQIKNGETVSLSDTNLDLSKNFQNTQELSESNIKLVPIYRILQEKVFNAGAAVISTKPIKIHQNRENTFIDHMITNWPNKVIHHEILKY